MLVQIFMRKINRILHMIGQPFHAILSLEVPAYRGVLLILDEFERMNTVEIAGCVAGRNLAPMAAAQGLAASLKLAA